MSQKTSFPRFCKNLAKYNKSVLKTEVSRSHDNKLGTWAGLLSHE
jgi:hypothetical protein